MEPLKPTFTQDDADRAKQAFDNQKLSNSCDKELNAKPVSIAENAMIMAKALTQVGYTRLSTPPSERTLEYQCNWCRESLKEALKPCGTSTITSRIKHNAGCPVALAHTLSK